jgi:hypothetical protein
VTHLNTILKLINRNNIQREKAFTAQTITRRGMPFNYGYSWQGRGREWMRKEVKVGYANTETSRKDGASSLSEL